MIKVNGISKSYGSQQALDNVSFLLNKGEITAFLGPNGAGKTTMMNIITGVLASDTGNILVDGKDIISDSLKIKSKIGYLPEYNPLYEDMYVQEYLEYSINFYPSLTNKKQRIADIIEQVGLTNEYKKKIGALSYGNKKRVGLAQAIVHDPEILILDEPTNGLDPNQHQKIKNLIVEFGKSKVVLFSSHRFDDVEDIASHYLILNKGKLVLNERATDIQSIEQTFYNLTK